ncbi:Hypothetical protein R9X50_00451600 [Acrodontium crateriforme]|uniref:Uncharacterized protein n=1 Tax=Acrodontium crateriforme TaxID=150365 RepID=A0AAQ3RA84_9PEZI|nr:Hypothetical protein R9X50_00451600 [Acrodontium crateriforme]
MKIAIAILALAAATVADEVVYLVNCQHYTANPNQPFTPIGSAMNYYADISQSQNGQSPDASSNYLTSGSYVQWEGAECDGYFPSSGVTFKSHIQGNGASLATGAYAGSGNNGSPFNFYKDNGRSLWSTAEGGVDCHSIYYCRKN